MCKQGAAVESPRRQHPVRRVQVLSADATISLQNAPIIEYTAMGRPPMLRMILW
jgi:hypothetical protein